MAKEGELKTEKRTLDKIVKAGEKAENEFKEFEKRDLKVREAGESTVLKPTKVRHIIIVSSTQ